MVQAIVFDTVKEHCLQLVNNTNYRVYLNKAISSLKRKGCKFANIESR